MPRFSSEQFYLFQVAIGVLFVGGAWVFLRPRSESQFRVRESYLAAQTAFRLMQLYADTILPQSSLTIESSLASYQTGGADFLSVLTNVMTRVDSEERYHEQKMMYALALARLEELTGVALEAQEVAPQ